MNPEAEGPKATGGGPKRALRGADQELPVIRAMYELILWLQPHISKFPRDHRFTLGERMEQRLYQMLEKLIHAKYGRDRRAMLEQTNLDLEVLRFQVRLAKDLKCVAMKTFGGAARRITDIGQQVGGWMKSLEKA
jgi:hypothetical protein